MIIKVKAATFIPAGTRCVTVTLDGHWRPATPGAIEFAYARPNIDAPYPAVEAGDEFWVQIKDQIVIVHNVHRLRTDGKPMCGQERLIIGDILTPHDKEVTCRACIDTCGCTGQGHKFVDGKCRACEQLEKHTHEYDGQGLCPCGADMQMGRPPVMEVAGGWSNEKSNANVDVLDDPKHEYSEECFCFSCKAFRQVGDEDFIKHLNAVTPLRGRIAMALWDFKKSRGHGMGEFGVLDENAWESLAMADAVLAVMDKPVPYKDPCPPATSPNSDQPATPRCPEAAPDDKTGTCFCDGPGCQGDKAATELSNESVKRFGAFIAQKEAALTPAQARDLAVQIVDSIHRYTIEFAADQAKHSNEYDVAEQILLRACTPSGYGESAFTKHQMQVMNDRDTALQLLAWAISWVAEEIEPCRNPGACLWSHDHELLAQAREVMDLHGAEMDADTRKLTESKRKKLDGLEEQNWKLSHAPTEFPQNTADWDVRFDAVITASANWKKCGHEHGIVQQHCGLCLRGGFNTTLKMRTEELVKERDSERKVKEVNLTRWTEAAQDRDTAMFALRDLVRAIDKKRKEECGCGSCRYGFEDFLDAGRELLTSLCPGCKGKYTENDKHTCVKGGD